VRARQTAAARVSAVAPWGRTGGDPRRAAASPVAQNARGGSSGPPRRPTTSCHFNLLGFTAGTSPASTLYSFSPLRPLQAASHTALADPMRPIETASATRERGVLNLKAP
jgi:hypothetical protein